MNSLKTVSNSRYLQYFAALTASLSLASVSTYSSWLSPSLPKLTSKDSPTGAAFTPSEASWIASSSLLGNVAGCFVAKFVIERFGRRSSLLCAAVPLFLPWIVIAFAKSAMVVIAARFVAGTASAVSLTAVPMYIGEIADKDIRGKLGLSCNLLMNTSNFLVLSVGPFVSYTALTLGCAVFPVVFWILFYFMPESPYYLIKTGREAAAKKNFIRFSSNNAEEKVINERFNEIEENVSYDMKNKSTLWEFLSKKPYRNSLIIMIGIKTLQHLSGTVAIQGYMQTIIESTDSSISPEKSSIILGFAQIFAVLASATLVDKMGRKPLLILSALGCALALTAEGIYFYFQDVLHGNMENLSWLPTTCLALYLVMNQVGVFSVPFVLMGEFFATNIKGAAVSLFFIYGSALSFLVMKLFEPISKAWGTYSFFWICAGFCILGCLFVSFMFPETKNKTLEEIQKKLNKKHNLEFDVVA